MIDDAWSEHATTPSQIDKALRELLAQRHRESDSFVPARVINLVVIVDGKFVGEVENRLERAGRYHPSRLILCIVDAGAEELDAWASLTCDNGQPQPGVITICRERVELKMGMRHLNSLDTIIDPLLVSELPTVIWAPHGHDDAVDRLQRLATVVLVDSQDESDVGLALARSVALANWAYVIDLAWLRSTPWRERVAGVFAVAPWVDQLDEIASLTVCHRHDSRAAGLLFCGWLASRLGWRVDQLTSAGDELVGYARGRRDDLRVCLRALSDQDAPGLVAVSIELASGEAVSLERARGGLKSTRRNCDGATSTFRVLGASRGEDGILAEGIRQALLRDRTYGPALAVAQELVP